jgi:hypothetical protein
MARSSARGYNRKMKREAFLAAALIAAGLAACAGPQDRIKRHQAEFDSYPPAIQQKIRDGRADVGMTKEQVALAMGRPDRIFTRKSAAEEREVWAYGTERPRAGLDIGVGMGMGPGPGAFAGGVGVEEDGEGALVRVVFQGGVVAAVETRQR